MRFDLTNVVFIYLYTQETRVICISLQWEILHMLCSSTWAVLQSVFFNKVSRPVIGFVREQGMKLWVYVDDGVTAAPHNAIVDHGDFFVDTFTEFSF